MTLRDFQRWPQGKKCSLSYQCGAVVQWLSLLHNFIRQSLNSGSAQVQILLMACCRFKMVRISDNKEIRLNAFRWSTISQKQFIIVINISREKTKVTQFARLCRMTCLIVALESFGFSFQCILSYYLLLVSFLFTPYTIPELFYPYSRWSIFTNY